MTIQIQTEAQMENPTLTNTSTPLSKDSATTKKTKTTKISPEKAYEHFNKKTQLVYNSPFYYKLKPEQREKIDSLFYDKVVSKSYSNLLKTPPTKADWANMLPGQKMKLAMQTQPNSLLHMIKDDEAPAKGMSSLDRTKYYGAKIVDSSLKYIDSAMGMLSKDMQSIPPVALFYDIKNHGFDPFSIKGEEQSLAKDVKKITTDPLKRKLDTYFKDVEPQVNNDLRAKIFGKAAGFIPDLALFKGISHGLNPIVGQLTKTGEGSVIEGGLIQKAGGLTKLLESSKMGRTVYRMISGTLEGYGINRAQGQSNPESLKDAPTWGLFSAALPFGHGSNQAAKDSAKTVFADTGYFMGADTVAKSMENTIKRQEMNVPPLITDPLIKKLDATNAQILNEYAKENHGKLYQFLTKEDKAKVTMRVQAHMRDAFANPAAYSQTSFKIESEGALAQQAKADPIFAKQLEKMKGITQKITGSEMLDGPVKEAQKVAKSIDNSLHPDKQINSMLMSGGKIVPGAASGESPEFLNNLLTHYHHPDVGFENPKHKVLMMWALRNEYPKAISSNIDSNIKQMYPNLTEKQLNSRLQFLKDHIDKLVATWDINSQGQNKRVFRSTELTRQKATEYQKELWDLYDSTFGEN